MEKASLHSPMEIGGEATTGTASDGNCDIDRLPGHFDKPRSPGGLPIVMLDHLGGVDPQIPDTASVPGDSGDLRYKPGTEGKNKAY